MTIIKLLEKFGLFLAIIWFTTSIPTFAANPPSEHSLESVTLKPQLTLTPEEQAWLDEKHIVRARVTQYPPYMFIFPRIQGVAMEYLRSFCEHFGISIEFVPSEMPFLDSIHDIETDRRYYDLHPTMMQTPERLQRFAMTDHYFSSPWVIISRSEVKNIKTMEDLKGRVLSVERGYVMQDLLEKKYPRIQPAIYESTMEALLAVATHKADAYIGSFAISSYVINNKGLINLQVMGNASLGDHKMAMAMRKDWASLASIFNKWLLSLDEEDQAAIQRKWTLAVDKNKSEVNLTKKEETWLTENQTVRVRVLDFPPYIIPKDDGDPEGIAIDYLKLIAERTGIKFRYHSSGKIFSEAFDGLSKHQGPDLISTIVSTPERQESVFFFKELY